MKRIRYERNRKLLKNNDWKQVAYLLVVLRRRHKLLKYIIKIFMLTTSNHEVAPHITSSLNIIINEEKTPLSL
jgi:hypothetical protein